MSHWADPYVGLSHRAKGRERSGLDCYGLLRLVWLDVAGFEMPRFDGADDPALVIAREARRFDLVEPAAVRPLDAVRMYTDICVAGRWQRAPIHLGVVVTPGLVLHIEQGRTSRIEGLERLDIIEFRRGPGLPVTLA